MIKLKNDRFRKTRGGASKLLTLVCGNCRTKLFDYQKDGKGTIIRLYLDRIVANHQNINIKGKYTLPKLSADFRQCERLQEGE
jgi:hypothetical protein